MPAVVSKKVRSRKLNKGEKSWHIGRVISGMDSFGMEVPNLNLKGETHVNTLIGGVVSALILMLTLAFAANTAIELVQPQNPSMKEVTTKDYFDGSVLLDLRETNFKIAFSLYDIIGEKLLNDTSYVQVAAYVRTLTPEGDNLEILSEYHECTESDYAQFNPTARWNNEVLKVWKERGLFCFEDFPTDTFIGGTKNSKFYKDIVIMAAPCNLDQE